MRCTPTGASVMLEVVSEAADAELRSIEAARSLGVDWILGGTHADEALAVLAGSPARVLPIPGHHRGSPQPASGHGREHRRGCRAPHSARRRARTGPAGVSLRRGRGGGGCCDGRRVRRPGHRRRQRRLPGADRDAGASRASGATPSAVPSSRASCRAGRASPTRSARCSPSPRRPTHGAEPLMRRLASRPADPVSHAPEGSSAAEHALARGRLARLAEPRASPSRRVRSGMHPGDVRQPARARSGQ